MFREFVVGKQQRADAHDRDLALAWRIAVLERQEKLPRLETLLTNRPRRQTAAEQRGMLHLLSETYGIPLRQAQTRKPH